jgi:polyribonucleotide 5'-hydroxyl-kinase
MAASQSDPLAAWAGGDENEDDDYDPAASLINVYEKATPSLGLQNCLLAITHADPGDSQDAIKESSIMGYVYVADVDDEKRKLKLLSPMGGRVPAKAMIWGLWPEDVIDLVG